MAKKGDILPIWFHDADYHLTSLINEWTKAINLIEKQPKKELKPLCCLWQVLGEQYDTIENLKKQLGALFDRLDKDILPKAFETQGIDKIQYPELKRSFYPSPQYSASIVKDKQKEALQWLRDNGLGELVTETVNRNTLAATLKGRLLEENLDPPESMTLTKYTIIGSSKYTPKEK